MQKLFLIDGHALIFRMYYAFLRRPMINSKGADMSILFGFTKYLLEMIEREKPTHLAVSFDPPGGTFRNEMYPPYKGTRPPTPQLIIDALEPLTELLQAMNIPVLTLPGFEADDVIGSMAAQFAGPDLDVYMVTPDKDYGQLIAEHAFQLKPGKSGGADEVVGPAEICSKYGIGSPRQVIDMLTLCGDTADNVPGVKGVGEVGAGKLIAKYGSVENIYDHLDELSPKQQVLFEEARDHIALSKALVTIKTDIPLEVSLDDMRLDMDFSPAVADLFEKYEFNSLRRFISHVARPEVPAVNLEMREVTPAELVKAARSAGKMALRAGEPFTAATLGGLVAEGPVEAFQAALEDPAIEKWGFDLKAAAHGIGRLEGRWMDLALLHYLIDPEKSHKAEILIKSYLGVSIEEEAPEAPAALSLFDEAPEETVIHHTKEAAALLPLGEKLLGELHAKGLEKLYFEMEEPLSKVLFKMEQAGVKVDVAQLNAFAGGLRKEIAAREARVRELAGAADLNVSSPKQIGEVLFEKLALDPKAKKSARGQYTTDEATLTALYDRHPIIAEILEFRAANKLLSTYIEPFPGYVSPRDGRVHTTFNQALTATGRLSSSNPNLQNIPIRTERGREIRRAFVPGTPGNVIMSADYSQIELRLMAHLSCDAHLVSAFRAGEDVHAATAAKIFGIPLGEVSPAQRRIAKTANFGIMYGISSFGLAERLHLPRKEAKQIIDDYFASFPAIRSFIDATIESCRENGYVETLFGRRRYLPDINAKNATVRALAERNAVNAPIQGSSADIIKLAMIHVDRRMAEAGLRSRMVLQIHDELLFDCLPEEVDALRQIVVEEMEHVVTLSIPLTVECNVGTTWLDAH